MSLMERVTAVVADAPKGRGKPAPPAKMGWRATCSSRSACMSNSLNGKVALITGASTGIGLASAHELAARGVRLFITGRRGPEIADAARALGRGTVGVQADVSNLTDLDRLYEQISRDAGRLDVVFANAGGVEMLPLEAITAERLDRTFGTNVKGLLFTVQKALPLMKEGGSLIL